MPQVLNKFIMLQIILLQLNKLILLDYLIFKKNHLFQKIKFGFKYFNI